MREVDYLKSLLAQERGCAECWKGIACGKDCHMLDVAALRAPLSENTDRLQRRYAAIVETQSIGERLRAKGYADVPSNADRIAAPQSEGTRDAGLPDAGRREPADAAMSPGRPTAAAATSDKDDLARLQRRYAAIVSVDRAPHSATRDSIIEQCITVLDTHGLASIFTPDKALTIRQVLRAMKGNVVAKKGAMP